MSVKLDKNEFRSKNLAELKNTAHVAKCAHYGAIREIGEIIKTTGAKNILLYLPLGYEPDVLKVRRKFSHKCKFYAPFMVGVNLKMVRLRLPFSVAKFNVRQPSGRKIGDVKLDIAVVPAVGVDCNMARIGHGKGFYDRFFSSIKFRPKIILFVSVKDFFTSEIISLDYDAKGDIYVTPNKIYIRKKYDRSICKYSHGGRGRLGRKYVCKKNKRCKL
ncbi:5-formyltetrahydrofolate cyclo-ligase [uncultured Campylobacter sp.]|uniref:5-formyltetrahydrofolate cyclo-ligase n=1 Tax=uncultured Campylobacter sp. TaxID=218934 RepID=UPI0025DC7788|nr:5-formyltetrahydrofolate cyclo-ligase [uncultured Campylobacter sp.]